MNITHTQKKIIKQTFSSNTVLFLLILFYLGVFVLSFVHYNLVILRNSTEAPSHSVRLEPKGQESPSHYVRLDPGFDN